MNIEDIVEEYEQKILSLSYDKRLLEKRLAVVEDEAKYKLRQSTARGMDDLWVLSDRIEQPHRDQLVVWIKHFESLIKRI